jgi:hypothetical protein
MDTNGPENKTPDLCPCGRETCCPDCGLCEKNHELSVP